MKEEFSRTAMLIGESGVTRLNDSSVIVFGAGGVGSFAIEALARCGLKKLGIVDSDSVSVTNINRQLIALHSTVGMKKVDAAAARVKDISPDTVTEVYDMFYSDETKDTVDLSGYDYIIDAIDSMDSKILLIKEAKAASVPIISSLSTGNKLDSSSFRISDIYSTSVCPIAKIMRRRLKEEGIDSLKVIYSDEPPIKPNEAFANDGGKRTVGSISFVPSRVGLMLAECAVKDLILEK